jgi:hypothetical protein
MSANEYRGKLMPQTRSHEISLPEGLTDQEFDLFLESLGEEETRQLLDKLIAEIDRLMDDAYRERYTVWLRQDGWPEEKIAS